MASRAKEFLRNFIQSSEGKPLEDHAAENGVTPRAAHQWAKGNVYPGAREGLTEAEKATLDARLAEPKVSSRAAAATPAEVTVFLRGFIESPEGTTLESYARSQGVNGKTAGNWASGNRLPEGREGLSQTEEERLDARLQGHKATPGEVTVFLRGFIESPEGTTLKSYAEAQSVPEGTAMSWASGIRVPGGRESLSEAEKVALETRRGVKHKVTTGDVTVFLRNFIQSSEDKRLEGHAEENGVTLRTAQRRVKGEVYPGVREGLTEAEKATLDARPSRHSAHSGAESALSLELAGVSLTSTAPASSGMSSRESRQEFFYIQSEQSPYHSQPSYVQPTYSDYMESGYTPSGQFPSAQIHAGYYAPSASGQSGTWSVAPNAQNLPPVRSQLPEYFDQSIQPLGQPGSSSAAPAGSTAPPSIFGNQPVLEAVHGPDPSTGMQGRQAGRTQNIPSMSDIPDLRQYSSQKSTRSGRR